MKLGVLNRLTGARFVLLAWAAALAWLARREFGKDEAQTIAEATIRLNPEAHFFAVTAAGVQIGYASLTVDTFPAGFKLSEVMALDVPDGDSTRRVTRRRDLVLTRSLRLASFNRTVTGAGLFEEFSGRVDGDTVVRMQERDQRNGEPVKWNIRIPGDVVLPEVLPYRLAFGKRLEPGRTVTANVLDLATGTVTKTQFAATAESTFVIADSAIERRATHEWVPARFDTVRAWRIEHAAAGTPMVTWVDEHGGLVHSEAALGVRLERGPFELVSFNYRTALERTGPGDREGFGGMQTLVAAGREPDPGDERVLHVTAPAVERFLLPRVAWLAGGRQAAAADSLRIGLVERPRGDSAKSEDYLDPVVVGPGVPPAVAVEANRIAGDYASPTEKVAHLLAWTSREVRLDRTEGAPLLSGSVLAAKRAGAEGKTALFVDMARAQGLEARSVGGLALSGGRRYGHTWAEVRLAGAWVSVDPTFGAMPAPASLIRVGVGVSGRPIDLIPLIGSAAFEPVSGARP